jgi:hypothetical protein
VATADDRGSRSVDPPTQDAASSGELHQTLLREVNERIEGLNGEWEITDGRDTVLCECGHPACLEQFDIVPAEYERVRAFPDRFLVKPDHVGPDERIIQKAAGYVVVEKLGPPASIPWGTRTSPGEVR